MMNSSIPPENSRFQNHAVPPPSEKDLPLEKDANAPVWLVNGKVQEAKFCTCFLSRHPMICVQDSFYTKEGKITDEAQIRRAIYQELRPYCQTGLNKRISNLLDLLRLEACSEPLPLHLDRIHVSNGTMKSLYDRSNGFYRRQLILSVRERDPRRRDDPFLSEKLQKETEGIFLWCLDGLRRLMTNRFHFTISARSAANMVEAVREGNNIVEFMESTGYIELHADREITSKSLYSIYERWCTDNAYKPHSPRSLSNFLVQHERTYNLEHTNNVRNEQGKRVRGFLGICAAT